MIFPFGKVNCFCCPGSSAYFSKLYNAGCDGITGKESFTCQLTQKRLVVIEVSFKLFGLRQHPICANRLRGCSDKQENTIVKTIKCFRFIIDIFKVKT